uniref:protein JOKA2-like n=1 Tax=Erigeron canadensis TaxID=72917 RepID=UPI001CB97E74|nr:protein JOKA2-like [Erigeron canadensis]
MKYVDEDGDLVMLASDDDLHDIVLQSLNPLRITVKLNKERKLGGTTVAPLTSEVSATLQSPQKESEFRLSNSLVPQTMYSSLQLEPQIHFLKSGVTRTLSSSSLQQPQSLSINSALSQNLKSSLQQIPSQMLNTVAEPSTSETSQPSEKMEAHATPKFTFMAGGASNVYGQTVKDSVSKVQVKRKVGSTNSKKQEKLVPKVVESTVPSFGFVKPFPTPFNATKGLKDSESKLDSICVSDVTVPDVTIMAPYTKFTKIWKMRNTGSLAWPQGSKFMCVSGVRSSRDSDSVDIEIPADGLPVDKDLDIKVEFTAPRHPFWHASAWRMVSPSGQKFGSMVSFSFQVENSFNKFVSETMANVDPPPVVRNPEVVNQDHLMDAENSFIKVSGSEGAAIDSQYKDQENDSDVSSNMATPSVYSAFSCTEVETALASLSVGLDTGSKVQPNIQEVSDDQEQALLKDLEVMGFKQLDLNKEILRINNYDLEKSVDDLCGVSDWDLLVDDLQAAGYADAKSRLLKKNNGSIKHVYNRKLESNNQ